MKMAKGWKRESARHSLARKGIKTGKKKTKQWTLADEKKQISKLKDTHLLTQFENQDYIQFEYGQTSRWDALVYGLLENEIAKRGLEDKASEIVEKNKRKTERLGL